MSNNFKMVSENLFYFLGDAEPSENLILEDWFKNDPVNQIGILEKQINELLCDEKSVKSSSVEGEPGSGPESDPDSQQQEKVNDPKNQNEVENEEGGTNDENEEQNDSERNGLEYSLPKNNANTVIIFSNFSCRFLMSDSCHLDRALNVQYFLLLSFLTAVDFYNLGHIQGIRRVH